MRYCLPCFPWCFLWRRREVSLHMVNAAPTVTATKAFLVSITIVQTRPEAAVDQTASAVTPKLFAMTGNALTLPTANAEPILSARAVLARPANVNKPKKLFPLITFCLRTGEFILRSGRGRQIDRQTPGRQRGETAPFALGFSTFLATLF